MRVTPSPSAIREFARQNSDTLQRVDHVGNGYIWTLNDNWVFDAVDHRILWTPLKFDLSEVMTIRRIRKSE
jgi:hypothetical protein